MKYSKNGQKGVTSFQLTRPVLPVRRRILAKSTLVRMHRVTFIKKTNKTTTLCSEEESYTLMPSPPPPPPMYARNWMEHVEKKRATTDASKIRSSFQVSMPKCNCWDRYELTVFFPVLSRSVAKFMVTSEIASTLYQKLEGTLVPDEHFYSTLVTVTKGRNGVNN